MVRVSQHDSFMTLMQKDPEGKDSQLLSLVCLFPSTLFLTLSNARNPVTYICFTGSMCYGNTVSEGQWAGHFCFQKVVTLSVGNA